MGRTKQSVHHWCIGVDLHKDTMTVCTYCRCCGEVNFRKIACKNRDQVAQFFRDLPRPHTVAIEAVGFYRWLWELLEPIVEKLLLADATQARNLLKWKPLYSDLHTIVSTAWQWQQKKTGLHLRAMESRRAG